MMSVVSGVVCRERSGSELIEGGARPLHFSLPPTISQPLIDLDI